jgi:hypothetical protein
MCGCIRNGQRLARGARRRRLKESRQKAGQILTGSRYQPLDRLSRF